MITREERIRNNKKCMDILDDIDTAVCYKGEDIYSVTTSYLFGKPVDQCREFNPDTMEPNEEGRRLRTATKKLMLNRMSVEDVSKDYEITDLALRMVTAFPWTDIYDLDNSEIVFNLDYAKENDLRESFSFLTLIRGYCQMKKFQIEMFTRFEK